MNSDENLIESDDTKPVNEKKRWALICLAIVAFGVVALFLMSLLKSEPEVTVKKASSLQLDAEQIELQQGHFDIRSSGRVSPAEQVQLQAQVSGDVVAVSEKMKSGAYFSKGDVLVSINPTAFKARLDELQAQRKSAKAELVLAATLLRRTQELREANAASQEELDQRQATRSSAQARVDELQALIVSARLNLEKTEIKAPFSGRVMSENISVGDVIMPGAVFAEIYSTDFFEVPVSLKVSDALLLENIFADPGGTPNSSKTQVKVETEFGGDVFSWPGYLDRVEAGLDTTTRTVDVIVRIHAPKQRGTLVSRNHQVTKTLVAPPLLPNMFVTAVIPTAPIDGFIKVKRDAVRSDGSLWLVDTNDSGEGHIFIAETRLLSSQLNSAYLSVPSIGDSPVYVLGSDTGMALPGNQVRIRQAIEKNVSSSGSQNDAATQSLTSSLFDDDHFNTVTSIESTDAPAKVAP